MTGEIITAAAIIAGCNTEAGKRMVGAAIDAGGGLLEKIEDNCTTVRAVKETVRQRSNQFLRFLGAACDGLLGVPVSPPQMSIDRNPFEEPDNLLLYGESLQAAIRSSSEEKSRLLANVLAHKLVCMGEDTRSMSLANAISAVGMLSQASIRACAAVYLLEHSDNIIGYSKAGRDHRFRLIAEAFAPVFGPFFGLDAPDPSTFDYVPLISSRCAIPRLEALNNFGRPHIAEFLAPRTDPLWRLVVHADKSSGLILTDIGNAVGSIALGTITGLQINLDFDNMDAQTGEMPIRFQKCAF